MTKNHKSEHEQGQSFVDDDSSSKITFGAGLEQFQNEYDLKSNHSKEKQRSDKDALSNKYYEIKHKQNKKESDVKINIKTKSEIQKEDDQFSNVQSSIINDNGIENYDLKKNHSNESQRSHQEVLSNNFYTTKNKMNQLKNTKEIKIVKTKSEISNCVNSFKSNKNSESPLQNNSQPFDFNSNHSIESQESVKGRPLSNNLYYIRNKEEQLEDNKDEN